MKSFLKVFFIIIFLISASQAQQLYFCQGHTDTGEPISASNKWKIKANGGYLYILLDNENRPLPEGVYYLVIKKKDGERFEEFDQKTIRKTNEDPWIAYNYIFREGGEFQAYFVRNRNRLATEEVTIIMESNPVDKEVVRTSMYYDELNMFFCEWVIAERPIKPKQATSLKINEGWIFFYMRNNNMLNTNKLIVEIWRQNFSSVEFDEFIETKEYSVTPEWTYTFFRYKFMQPGKYKFDIYTGNSIFVGSRTIDVSY